MTSSQQSYMYSMCVLGPVFVSVAFKVQDLEKGIEM